MKRFFHSESFITLLAIVIVLVLGVMCAAFTHNASSPLTSALSVVFSPLQKLSSTVSDEMHGLSSAFKSSSVYKKQNEELESELSDYRKKLSDYDEMKKKVETYEKFYDVKTEHKDFKFSYGTVISRDAADPYGSFTLSVGSKDGIKVNDPVIYGKYVIGVVRKVNLSTCVVYTVLDPRVNIGAYESGTREYGYVSGDASLYRDGLCRLSGLEKDTSIVKSGIVCTSGAGGVFPAGLIIGEVEEVCNDDVSITAYAKIKPYASLSGLTDVFVITSFEGQGETE